MAAVLSGEGSPVLPPLLSAIAGLVDVIGFLSLGLKRLRRDVTFARFLDESHTFSGTGKPRHRLERHRLILDWFAKYLKRDEAVEDSPRTTPAGRRQ